MDSFFAFTADVVLLSESMHVIHPKSTKQSSPSSKARLVRCHRLGTPLTMSERFNHPSEWPPRIQDQRLDPVQR
jgi:hypothetical protein